MKVSREQAAKNRERILKMAARLFRERGYDGIGVADLMKSAGLTHGGFYGQFTSKEDLLEQATEQVLKENARNRLKMIRSGDDAWESFKQGYLSPIHRDKPGHSCAMTTLAIEAPRRALGIRRVLTQGLQALIDDLTRILPQKHRHDPREQALTALSTLVGAVVLSRAVDNPELADEILEAVKGNL